MNNIESFDSTIDLLRQQANSKHSSLMVLKQHCEKMLHLISTDSEHHSDYVRRFVDLVDELKATHNLGIIELYFNLLNFFMRKLKYPEVEQALKKSYHSMINPDARLRTEALIQLIFDSSWDEGECIFEDDPETHWWT